MKRSVIDITNILSPDLKSRVGVQDLSLFIKNMSSDEVVIDFANVKFATRSFIDEFYNVFLKPEKKEAVIINVPADIQLIFDSVKQTQNKPKKARSDATVVQCKTTNEVLNYLNSLTL